jgi:hypothetical protein
VGNMGRSEYLGVPIEFADGKQYEIRNHVEASMKVGPKISRKFELHGGTMTA